MRRLRFASLWLGLLWGGCLPASDPPCDGLCTEVAYERSGGIVGGLDEVRIQTDGGIAANGVFLGDRSGVLAASQIAELAALLAGWNGLPDPPAGTGCADTFMYAISYNGRTLDWDDCSTGVPQQLNNLSTWIEQTAGALDSN